MKRRERKKRNGIWKFNKSNQIKSNAPDQNATNLTVNGLSFTSKDINWYELRKDFNNIDSQLQQNVLNAINPATEDISRKNNNSNESSKPPKKKKRFKPLHPLVETKINSFESFISAIEKDLFNPKILEKEKRYFNSRFGLVRSVGIVFGIDRSYIKYNNKTGKHLNHG